MSINFLLVSLFIIGYVFQNLFSYQQSKHMSRVYVSLAKKYKGNFFIGTNKRKWLGTNPITFIVTDKEGNIKECYLMKGILVTAKMQEVTCLKGGNITQLNSELSKNFLENRVGKNGYKAILNACNNISNYQIA